MIATLAVTLFLGQAATQKTVTAEVASGYSGYLEMKEGQPPPEMDLEEIGEAFTVYRSGKSVRVELGKELLLLCRDGDEYIAVDLKKKVGVRYLVKSARHPEGDPEKSGYSFARYTMWMFFPLWPDQLKFMHVGAERATFVKNDREESARLTPFEHPTFGEVVTASNGSGFVIRRRDVDASPCVLTWVHGTPTSFRTTTYTELFQKKEVPASLFSVPDGIKLEDFSGFSDTVKWSVFKDMDDFIKWRNPLTADDRKPRKS